MSTAASMTTTSYSILGLLAIKPWTTYELVQQVELSLRRIWPRAQSKLYEEPKKLVALGYARASKERVGKRSRTRYSITPKGRRALARWLKEPGMGPVLEFELLLKIHFADGGTTQDVRRALAATLDWARAENETSLAVGRAYLDGAGSFPERAALNQLGGRFLTDFYAMVAEWAEWATAVVERWPEDPSEATMDREAQLEAIRIAERVAGRVDTARRSRTDASSLEPPATALT